METKINPSIIRRGLPALDSLEAKGAAASLVRADLTTPAGRMEASERIEALSRRQRALIVAGDIQPPRGGSD